MGKIKQALIFSLKVWITTMLLSPLVLFGIQYIGDRCPGCDFRQYYLTVGGECAAFFLLLPLIFFVVVRSRKSYALLKNQKKVILIIGTFLATCYAVMAELIVYGYKDQTITFYSLLYILIFPLITGLGLWLYKLKPEQE